MLVDVGGVVFVGGVGVSDVFIVVSVVTSSGVGVVEVVIVDDDVVGGGVAVEGRGVAVNIGGGGDGEVNVEVVIDGVVMAGFVGVDTVGHAASTVVSQIPHSPSVS